MHYTHSGLQACKLVYCPAYRLYFSMGETETFQPLTREDRITVILYRAGIVLSTVFMAASSVLAVASVRSPDMLAVSADFFGSCAKHSDPVTVLQHRAERIFHSPLYRQVSPTAQKNILWCCSLSGSALPHGKGKPGNSFIRVNACRSTAPDTAILLSGLYHG